MDQNKLEQFYILNKADIETIEKIIEYLNTNPSDENNRLLEEFKKREQLIKDYTKITQHS